MSSAVSSIPIRSGPFAQSLRTIFLPDDMTRLIMRSLFLRRSFFSCAAGDNGGREALFLCAKIGHEGAKRLLSPNAPSPNFRMNLRRVMDIAVLLSFSVRTSLIKQHYMDKREL